MKLICRSRQGYITFSNEASLAELAGGNRSKLGFAAATVAKLVNGVLLGLSAFAGRKGIELLRRRGFRVDPLKRFFRPAQRLIYVGAKVFPSHNFFEFCLMH